MTFEATEDILLCDFGGGGEAELDRLRKEVTESVGKVTDEVHTHLREANGPGPTAEWKD